jgi:hypothetical protein
MNEKILRFRNKSLRQTADPRYNRRVENHAQAPIEAPILFLVTPRPQKPFPKPCIINNLHTLNFDLSANRSFQSTCKLFAKQPGVYSPPHFETRYHRAAPSCAAFASQNAAFSKWSWHNPTPQNNPSVASPSSPLNPIRRRLPPRRFSLARKKQSTAQSPETRLSLSPLTKYPFALREFFRRTTDEARAFPQ